MHILYILNIKHQVDSSITSNKLKKKYFTECHECPNYICVINEPGAKITGANVTSRGELSLGRIVFGAKYVVAIIDSFTIPSDMFYYRIK